MSTLPTFIVIGAMKSGTTSLHRYLQAHDDVFLPAVKEIEFFSEDDRWERGEAWYRKLFEPGREVAARGEISTGYSKLPRYPEAADRMHLVVPEAHIVYLVREPIARLQSHYVHNVLEGFERQPIAEVVTPDSNYVMASRYAMQLERYQRLFGDDRILVAFAEDLRADRAAALRRIFSFIGVDDRLPPVDDEDEAYVSASRRATRRFVQPLTRSRALQVLRSNLPRGALRAAGRLAQRDVRPGEIDGALPHPVLETVWESLAADVAALQAFTGRLPSAWSAWTRPAGPPQ